MNSRVTNLRHESLVLGDFERHLVQLLDGRNTKADLIARLGEIVATGELSVSNDGAPVRDVVRIEAIIGETIDSQMKNLAQNALLVR